MTEAGDISLGWESIKGLLGKFAQAATGFAGMFIFTRIVEKDSFGGFYLLLAVVMIADRPLRWISQAVQKRWSEENAPKEEILGSVLLLTTAAILMVSVLAGLFGDLLVGYTNLEGSPMLFVALFGSFAFFVPFQNMMSAEGWPSKQTWNDTLRSFLTLPLQLLLVTSGLGALGMGYGLVAATFLVIPVAVYFVRRRPTVPTKATILSLWQYARYSSIESIVGKAYDRIDVLLLGFLVGSASVANYEVALKLTVPAVFVSGVVTSGLMPKISNTLSKGGEIRDDLINSVAYVSILGIPIFFGALAIPRPLIVTAFGPQYSDAVPYLIGLAFYQLLSTQSSVYLQTISGMDLPEVSLRIKAITFVVNIIFGVSLAVQWGPLGIVVATIIAEGIQYLMAMAYIRRTIDGVTSLPRPLLMQVASGIAMYLIVNSASDLVSFRSWHVLVVVLAVGAVTYGLCLLFISPAHRFTAYSIYQDATT